MKKIAKLFLGAASMSTIIPVAAVVSCGGNPTSDANSTSEGNSNASKAMLSGEYVDWIPSSGPELKHHTSFITDGGLLVDHTFNQSTWEGVQAAYSGTEAIAKIEPQPITELDSSRLIETYTDQKYKGAKLLVTAGFHHIEPLNKFAPENPEMAFLLVDGTIDASKADGTKVQQGNVASITFKTGQAAFLEGVAAAKHASSSNHHKIGVYGGMAYKSVIDYIVGFTEGVRYWNIHKPAGYEAVSVVDSNGHSINRNNIEYAGSFQDGGKSAEIANKIAGLGVDLIMSVGAAQYKDAFNAAKNHPGTKVIGVDVDIQKIYEVTNPADKDLIFGSILKNLKEATTNALTAIFAGETSARTYIGKVHTGDLNSGEVGISNTKDLDDAIAAAHLTKQAVEAEAKRLNY